VKSHYEILGVAPDADEEAIKTAYRRAAREFHPDVNGAPEARVAFEQATTAYETLLDPERRKAYDQVHRTLSEQERAAEIRENMRRIREEREREKEAELAKRAEERRVEHMQATQGQATEKVRILVQTMEALAAQGRLEEADRTALEIIEQDPKNAAAYAVRADWAMQQGNAKAASRFMAFAAQNAPHIPEYEQKYRRMIGQGASEAKVNEMAAETEAAAAPLVPGGFIAAALAFYPVLATEPLLMPTATAIDRWTVGTVTSLLVAGFALGLAGSWKRFLQPMAYHLGPSSQVIAPLTWVIVTSPISFWLTLLGLGGMFLRSRALPPSVSRAAGIGFAGVTLFSLVGGIKSPEYAMQVALWGGNLLMIGVLLGWWLGDLRRR